MYVYIYGGDEAYYSIYLNKLSQNIYFYIKWEFFVTQAPGVQVKCK